VQFRKSDSGNLKEKRDASGDFGNCDYGNSQRLSVGAASGSTGLHSVNNRSSAQQEVVWEEQREAPSPQASSQEVG
jgi:hypothetical protein